MNKNQFEGAATKLKGSVQKMAGDLTDNEKLKAKGVANKATGAAQELVGDAQAAAKKATWKQ